MEPPTSRTSVLRLGVAGTAALLMTHANITVRPATHDFGEHTVNSLSPEITFRMTFTSMLLFIDSVTVKVAGQNPGDFGLVKGGFGTIDLGLSSDTAISFRDHCATVGNGIECTVDVRFRPRSVGPKLARLDIDDLQGNRASAQLAGKGIAVTCLHRVVPCNFAHMWSGRFGWTSVTKGPDSRDSTDVSVRVTNGVAFCRGLVEETSQGTTRIAEIRGPGLVAVELLKDPVYPWVYLITVACPSPDWPEDPSSGTPATPSRPAEMGHEEQSSEKQPATSKNITLEELLSEELSRLEGQITHRDSDPASGSSGYITITWNLTRS